MTRYIRAWNCSTCKQPLYYDDEKKTMSCGCGTKRHKIRQKEFTLFKMTGVYMHA